MSHQAPFLHHLAACPDSRQQGRVVHSLIASEFLNHGDAATKGRAHHHRTTCRVDGLLEDCKHQRQQQQLWWESVITVYSHLLLEDCNHIKQEQAAIFKWQRVSYKVIDHYCYNPLLPPTLSSSPPPCSRKSDSNLAGKYCMQQQ